MITVRCRTVEFVGFISSQILASGVEKAVFFVLFSNCKLIHVLNVEIWCSFRSFIYVLTNYTQLVINCLSYVRKIDSHLYAFIMTKRGISGYVWLIRAYLTNKIYSMRHIGRTECYMWGYYCSAKHNIICFTYFL